MLSNESFRDDEIVQIRFPHKRLLDLRLGLLWAFIGIGIKHEHVFTYIMNYPP